MSECGCGLEQADKLERSTLMVLLVINAIMFVLELTLGWFAQSTGLIADSLDMLADAAVYGISLFVVCLFMIFFGNYIALGYQEACLIRNKGRSFFSGILPGRNLAL